MELISKYNGMLHDLINEAQERRPHDLIVSYAVRDDPRDPNWQRLFIQYESGCRRMYAIDRLATTPSKPKRLRCEYCGRIALTDRPTCEGCGAVLPWEIDYEA